MTQQIDYFNNHIKEFLEDCVIANKETNLLKVLYSEVVSADIASLADEAPASVATHLCKKNLVDFNDLIVNFVNMLDNGVVTQKNYRADLSVVLNGNAAPPAQVVSNATENYANRIYELAKVFQALEENALRLTRAYTDIYLKNCVDAVYAVNPTAVVPGTSSSAAALSLGVMFMDDVVKFFSNQAVATSDRKIILNNWVPRYL